MPSPDQYTFDPGFDYTASFGGYASSLTQGVQLMTPNSQHGIVAYMNTQPLTTGSPAGEYPPNWYTFNQRGLWVKPSTGETYSYKTGVGYTNVASLIPANTITNAMVKDSVVGLEKIAVPPGTTAGFVPTVNAGGNALAYSDPVNGRVDGSITVAKLAAGASNQFLRTIGGIVQWNTFDGDDINALLSVTRLVPTYIQPGGPLQVMATDPTANYSNWFPITDLLQDGSILPAKLSGAGATVAGQYLARNSSNTGWEWAAPGSAAAVTTSWNSGLLTLANATVTHTPAIAGIPKLWNVVMVCNSTEHGYASGEEVPLTCFGCDYDGGVQDGPFCSVTVNATDFIVKVFTSLTTIIVISRTTGANVLIDPSKWRLKIYALN